MRGIVITVSLAGLGLSWWFWWAHFLTWIPAAIIYSIMLQKLRSDSPLLVMSAIPHRMIVGMSEEATSWLNKNGHALIMWGAAIRMGQHLKHMIAIACFAVLITAFHHSWWWLVEFVALAGIMISLHDGFRPMSEEQLAENAASGRNAFLATEIAPLFKGMVEMSQTESRQQ
jgi:hypothetical protein